MFGCQNTGSAPGLDSLSHDVLTASQSEHELVVDPLTIKQKEFLGRVVSMGSLPDEVTDAAGRGDEAALLAWLDRGGQMNAIDGANSSTALMNAAYFGHERVVELLLHRGAEIN